MKSLYKILTEENQKAREYFENYIAHARKIKEIARKILTDASVLVFGSAVQQEYSPGSDIDILIISSEIPSDLFSQAALKVKIKEKFPGAPFEIHLVTPEEYENWYKNFIKKDYVEVN